LQIKTKIVSCHTADFKPVKQEVNGTVLLPPLVFPGLAYFGPPTGTKKRFYKHWNRLNASKMRGCGGKYGALLAADSDSEEEEKIFFFKNAQAFSLYVKGFWIPNFVRLCLYENKMN